MNRMKNRNKQNNFNLEETNNKSEVDDTDENVISKPIQSSPLLKELVKIKIEINDDDNYILSVWRSFLTKFDYYDTAVDEDGLYNGLVLPPTQHMYIFSLSFLSLISGIYAISRGYYDVAAVPLGVLLTSINYWRHPLFNSKRRYIDMIYVHIAMFYQIFRAYYAENVVSYYIILFASVCFFPLSWHYHEKKETWKGTFLHGMVHILGNVSNIVLYSGSICSMSNFTCNSYN